MDVVLHRIVTQLRADHAERLLAEAVERGECDQHAALRAVRFMQKLEPEVRGIHAERAHSFYTKLAAMIRSGAYVPPLRRRACA